TASANVLLRSGRLDPSARQIRGEGLYGVRHSETGSKIDARGSFDATKTKLSGNESMRLLILGTGGMANAHATNFSAIDGVNIVGGVDIVPDRLSAFSSQHKIDRQFGSVEDALAWGEFDAVANVTPDRIHHPTTMLAIAAGKHI